MLSRLWQGKAVYLHVVLPLVLSCILYYIKDNNSKFELSIILFVLMISGIALNPTSMYVIGFQIIFMLIAVSISKRNCRYILCSLPALFSIVFFSFLILLRTRGNSGQIEAASAIPDNFSWTTLLNFLGHGKFYFAMFIICSIFILIKGDLQARIICVYTPLLVFLGVWNPVMAPIVAKNLTMVPSFWRVYWLLPVDYAIAYCVCVFFEKKLKFILINSVMIGCILLSGKYIFSKDNNFVRAENKERIPQEVLQFGRIISDSKDNIVLSCDEGATTLRQEFNNIELIVSRYQYILDMFMYRDMQKEAEERILLMNFANGVIDETDTESIQSIGYLLKKYNIKWIIISDAQLQAVDYLHSEGYDVVVKNNGKVLLNNNSKLTD